MKPASRAFQGEFFCAGGHHPDPEGAFKYFKRSFVRPRRFEDLIDVLRPPHPDGAIRKRIVLVDGHPRSGKTWAVLAAIAEMADKFGLKEDEMWSSGFDSMKIFNSSGETLAGGIAKVLCAWKKAAPRARLVLLDDFLGTNVPREFLPCRNNEFIKLVRKCFTWDAASPLVKAMPPGSVLIVTGRSFHFTLLDIIYGIRSRESAVRRKHIEVIKWRRGLFRTLGSGDIMGSFDQSSLKRIFDRILRFHPSKSNSWWLLAAAPLVAFLNKSLRSPKEALGEQERSVAARVLFGEDIESLAQHIEMVWRGELVYGGSAFPSAKELEPRLLQVYMLYLAPALLFPERQAYRVLGVPAEAAQKLMDDLYLLESVDGSHSGRLPNEFYMLAVREHLEERLPMAAQVFMRLRNGEIADYRSTGMAVRALVERSLWQRKSDPATPLASEPEFCSLVGRYLDKNPSFLLAAETAALSDTTAQLCQTSEELNPGLAANVGWMLYKFAGDPAQEHRRAFIFEALENQFSILLDAVRAKPPLDRPSWAKEGYWNTIAAWYSTFLQWAIRMEERSETLDRLAKLIATVDEELRLSLRMILEDEILWALLEQGYNVSHLRESSTLERELGVVPDKELLSSNGTRFLALNRFFSLCWHNKWMHGVKSEAASGGKEFVALRDKLIKSARSFTERFRANALKELRRTPEVLDDNLDYHWCHFITQCALWRRDWTFAPDPDEYERNRIARGSGEASDNSLLMDIADAVSEFPCPSKRIRNLIFFLGTRASRLPTDRFHTFLKRIGKAALDQPSDLRSAILCAIFELHRQGYLQHHSVHTTKEFSNWCSAQLDSFHGEAPIAWRQYVKELALVTHPLDFGPSEVFDWRDICQQGQSTNKNQRSDL